jgi:superfamily II DNA or RNA helicase
MSEISSPGTIITARGRDWVVQPKSTEVRLVLRPLGGAESDQVVLCPALEQPFRKVGPASFNPPNPEFPGTHDGARLLRDALQLKLRSGAGPFRSFGNIAVEPKVYQLVPLLMAMKQDVVRLLIADDVGVGKTIEAGMIVRELMDRGEISRLAVLCPPHLIEQWHGELLKKFNIRAECITANRAAQIERNLPPGEDLFKYYPFVIISLDYIKSDKNRDYFLSKAPECIIVDEVHSCVSGSDKQLRQKLLQDLADQKERHLILLSATPYSGDNDAYFKLLGLLDPDFQGLADLSEGDPKVKKLREKLRDFFIQRRRKDIEEDWKGIDLGFPTREDAGVSYLQGEKWEQLYAEVIAKLREEYTTGERTSWFGMLALLRCLASSPDAAISALRTRSLESEKAARAHLQAESAPDQPTDELQPALAPESGPESPFIAKLTKLSGPEHDPKLKLLLSELKKMLSAGFNPVVFCRYVATTEYLKKHLSNELDDVRVESASGLITPEDRLTLIGDMVSSPKRLLVATDCLSEGVNLQNVFSAVIHYDLAWNPTRHEQRIGRVDRLGQPKSKVRSLMLHGEDNPVDALVMKVIQRKAESIKKELGVTVAVPTEGDAMLKVLVSELIKGDTKQGRLNFGESAELKALDAKWVDAREHAKKLNTIFAQRAIKPQEVIEEFDRQKKLLGDANAVQRFIESACRRLGTSATVIQSESVDQVYQVNLIHLPESLRERLRDEAGLEDTIKITFGSRAPAKVIPVGRSHPLVSLIAEYLLEEGLEGEEGSRSRISRCSACESADVSEPTVVLIMRIRHQIRLTHRNKEITTLMAEESVAYSFVGGRIDQPLLDDPDKDDSPLKLLDKDPVGNLKNETKTREVQKVLALLKSKESILATFAQSRAKDLENDHQRVRAASKASGQVTVTACVPADIIGVYVVLPTRTSL